MIKLFDRISRLDAHQRLIIGLLAAAVSVAMLYREWPEGFSLPVNLTIIWVVFALTVLGLMWLSIFLVHPRELPHLSGTQDSSRLFILLFVVVAAGASFGAIIALLGKMGTMIDTYRTWAILLAMLAVACSWSLVHTVFTLRYAHLYYGDDRTRKKPPGGLDFPNEPEPDYLDFAYFAFIIGMTSQTSDVSIQGRSIRRTALLHGVLAFLFNTIIIALTISGLSGLI